MTWPLNQDYNEAIQNPSLNLADPELQRGHAATTALGLPRPYSGNFADVYEMVISNNNNHWAIKCFTREVAHLRERYDRISQHLQQFDLPFLLHCQYQDQGIWVNGQWYPLLKMPWVQGYALNTFVKENVDRPRILKTLAQIWVRMAQRLQEARIAHADLQHGNVLLVRGTKEHSLAIKLVDYDGMIVPALESSKSGELGHPAYQHPQRERERIYSPEVDRFSHLVIYTALRAVIAAGRSLWERFDNDDNLLFRPEDFQSPGKSPLFYEMLKIDNADVRQLVELVIDACHAPIDRVPLLEEVVRGAKAVPVGARQQTAEAVPDWVGTLSPVTAGSNAQREDLRPGPVGALVAHQGTATPTTDRQELDMLAAAMATTEPVWVQRQRKASGKRRYLIWAIAATLLLVVGTITLIGRMKPNQRNAKGPPVPQKAEGGTKAVGPSPAQPPPPVVPDDPPPELPSVISGDLLVGAKRGDNWDIFLIGADGTTPKNLSNHSARDCFPCSSPQGTHIVFCSDRNGGNFEIFVMDADGKNARQLTMDPDSDLHAAWSPDGTRIAFQRVIGSKHDHFGFGANGNNLVEVANGLITLQHFVDSKYHVFIIGADGNNLVDVTKGRSNDFDPTWTRDGKIVFVSNRGGGGMSFFKADANGSNVHQLPLPRVGEYCLSPACSPDGTKIAFIGNVGDGVEIFVCDSDGQNLKQITCLGESLGKPAWSPDGKRLAFTTESAVCTMDADGKNLRRLTPLGPGVTYGAAVWRPASSNLHEEDGNKTLPIEDELTKNDPFDKLRRGSHRKLYKVTMLPGKIYNISLISNAFDTFLRLEDSQGIQIAQDDDGGEGLNSMISFSPNKADTYRIIVTSFGKSTGAFSLNVTIDSNSLNSLKPKTYLLNFAGRLSKKSPFDSVGTNSYCEIHNLKMVAGKVYLINLSSTAFDTHLRLEGSTTKQLCSVGEGGHHCGLGFRPPKTDTYRIIVTSFYANQTGDYYLTVLEE